jgi:hypothetical protein
MAPFFAATDILQRKAFNHLFELRRNDAALAAIFTPLARQGG